MFNEKIIEVFNNPEYVGILHGHNAQGTTKNEISQSVSQSKQFGNKEALQSSKCREREMCYREEV